MLIDNSHNPHKKIETTMSMRANPTKKQADYSKTAETFNPLKNGYTTFYMNDLEALRMNIDKQNSEISQLAREVEGARNRQGPQNTPGMQPPSDDLKQKSREKDLEFIQISAKLADLTENLKIRSSIFNESNSLQEQLLSEMRELNTQHMNLETQKRIQQEHAS